MRIPLTQCSHPSACIVSILRFRTLTLSTTSNDPTWDKTDSGVYGLIECNLGIICACVVTLRPLVHRLRRLLVGHKTPEQRPETPPHWARGRSSPYDMSFSLVGSTHVGSANRDVELDGTERGSKARASTAETVVAPDCSGDKDSSPNMK